MSERVAALYIDPLGYYPKMPGVDCWGEKRDARSYEGPMAIVAHPPCGPWSKLRHLCNDATLATADCGVVAVEQVRRWGGVLEHPAHSQLFAQFLPSPMADDSHGFSVSLDQCDWGHPCRKPTWLYCVGVSLTAVLTAIGERAGTGTPTHCVCVGPRQPKRLRVASKPMKRRTPPLFAEWLVSLARSVGGAA